LEYNTLSSIADVAASLNCTESIVYGLSAVEKHANEAGKKYDGNKKQEGTLFT
jgi:hypothetical protein